MATERKIQIRSVSAIVGGCAVLALSWLGVASAGMPSQHMAKLDNPSPFTTLTSEAMKLGATATSTAAEPYIATITKAQPPITGPAALPSEEANLP